MIAVSDTSVVLNLCALRQEELLKGLFGEVQAPSEVKAEFERLAKVDPRFAGLVFPGFILIRQPTRTDPRLLAGVRIHAGEVAAISLALEQNAEAVLLDDRLARKVASRLGCTVIGVLGILLQGKQAGLIGELRPLLDRLVQDAKFRLASTLMDEVLLLAGENPPSDSESRG